MKPNASTMLYFTLLAILPAVVAIPSWAQAPEKPAEEPKSRETDPATGTDKEKDDRKEELVPIDLKLPKPAFKGTPKDAPPGARLDKPTGKPRPPFLAPRGTTNVARGARVESSDKKPIIGDVKLVTDGDKEANEGGYVELGPGRQYVQIDLKSEQIVHAVVVWHYHLNARVYHDVVVQVSSDKDFISAVTTLFNNDHDNSSGFGIGEDLEYWETFEGKLVEGKGVKARYVRLFSNGSTADDQNHYTEVEVYAHPSQ